MNKQDYQQHIIKILINFKLRYLSYSHLFAGAVSIAAFATLTATFIAIKPSGDTRHTTSVYLTTQSLLSPVAENYFENE